MRVSERSDGLVVVVGGGADVRDHDRLAVPAQRVLQDARQLRVPAIIRTYSLLDAFRRLRTSDNMVCKVISLTMQHYMKKKKTPC